MFKDIRTYIIAGLSFTLIILVLRDCSRPSEQKEADRKQQYETEVAILKAEKAEISSRQEATVKTYNAKLKEDSLNLALQESKIHALERKAARQRVVVDTLILNNPDLMAFVSTQEMVINELKVEIDTLKSQAQFQRKLNEDLIAQEFVEDKIEAQMAIETSRRVAELEKSNKKKESGKKGWKVLAIVGTVLGFIGGSQL